MTKESGAGIYLKESAGTLTFRNQADDTDLSITATPSSHTDSVHSGTTANLLAALTPTFANWTTNPGINADIVRTLSNSILTTAGVGAAGNNTVTYDLGDSRIRIAFLISEELGGYLQISDDNITYYNLGYRINANQEFILATGKFRYLRYIIPGVVTVSQLIIQCYNIN